MLKLRNLELLKFWNFLKFIYYYLMTTVKG